MPGDVFIALTVDSVLLAITVPPAVSSSITLTSRSLPRV